MRLLLTMRYMLAVAAFTAATAALPQWSFTLDTTFRSDIIQQNVNSLLVLPDGKIITSGIMRFPGEMSDKRLVRLNENGSRDETFYNSGLGSGRITPWSDKLYVLNGSIVRRVILSSGELDNTFRLGYLPQPYFSNVTAGDYHVYPDGRVLLSGRHTLRDSIRGFEGQYNLIWFSNEGYLDTTRTHRQANGVIWEFKELPDGKFICTCTCSQYEGQPVSRVFRIHADGSLDTTFNAGVNWGNIYAYHPLPDGRVYVGGRYKRAVAPNDTLYLARFMPDGSLDPTFDHGNDLTTLPGMTGGPKVLRLYPWVDGRIFVTGVFQRVNDEARGAICVIDSTGTLTPHMDECMPGPFSYQGSTNAAVVEMVPIADGTGYSICGTYAGYDDGTTNDPDQRFVSRLLVSELSVSTPEPAAQPSAAFGVYPNPSRDQVVLRYDFGDTATQLRAELRDAVGRIVASIPLDGARGQKVFDTTPFAPGTYLVQYLGANGLAGTVPLVIQR